MTVTKITKLVLLSGVISLAGSTTALASDTVNLGDTGPSSVNNVTITTVNTVTATNNNNIQVNNCNVQLAHTGDANVSGNTNVGSATAGSVSNLAATSTVVAVSNSSAVVPGSGGGNGGSTGGNTGSGGVSGSNGMTTSGQQSNAGGKGVGTLPRTGPLGFVDVSALRNLYHPGSDHTPTQSVTANTRVMSASLIIMAALLTLAGTVGSAIYATKRASKV